MPLVTRIRTGPLEIDHQIQQKISEHLRR